MQKKISDTAKEVLGPKVHVHQDWFDENNEPISTVIKAKNKAYIEWQNDLSSASKKDKFKHLQSKVQLELRKMQDLWWQRKAEEIQHYADTHTPESSSML